MPAKRPTAKLVNAEVKPNDFCDRVRKNLAQCTIQEKRLALDALDIKVTATPKNIEIRGVIPIGITATQSSKALLTTAQTSA